MGCDYFFANIFMAALPRILFKQRWGGEGKVTSKLGMLDLTNTILIHSIVPALPTLSHMHSWSSQKAVSELKNLSLVVQDKELMYEHTLLAGDLP